MAISFLALFGIVPEQFPLTSFDAPLELIRDLKQASKGLQLASDILLSIEAQLDDSHFATPIHSKPVLFTEQTLKGDDLNNLLKDNDESIPH